MSIYYNCYSVAAFQVTVYGKQLYRMHPVHPCDDVYVADM